MSQHPAPYHTCSSDCSPAIEWPGFLQHPYPEHNGSPMDQEVRTSLEKGVMCFMRRVQCAQS